MKEEDRKYFEKLLLKRRRRLLEELGEFNEGLDKTPRDSSGDLSSYSYHMADQATDASEQEKKFYLASKGGRLLYHVDEALRRVRDGDYGQCQVCGEDISRERLEAVPHARLCIACKEREERGELIESDLG